MRKILGIILIFLTVEIASLGQSRILTGTLTAAPNTSTTILPHIVQTKTPDAQKEDSAMFNPRYIPPPQVENNASNTNSAANSGGNVPSQMQGNPVTNVETYQYKTPDSKPYVDGNNNKTSVVQTPQYHSPNQVPGTETYQYKTPEPQPMVDNRVKLSGARYMKRVVKRPSSSVEILNQNSIVSNPSNLAASQNFGNTAPITSPKWTPKKTWKRDTVAVNEKRTDNNVVAKNSLTPTVTVNNNNLTPTVTINPSSQTFVPVNNNSSVTAPALNVGTKAKAKKKYASNVVDNTPSQPQQVSQESTDYKLNITPDGKYTLVFFNNGGSITVTEFGRIISVTSPTSGPSASPQYDYRGLLQSVGNLPLQYTYEGRLLSVGSTVLGYNYNGNIQSIGNTSLYYNSNGSIDKVGNSKILYDANGNVNPICDNNSLITFKQW